MDINVLARYIDLNARESIISEVLEEDLQQDATDSLKAKGLLESPQVVVPRALWDFMPLIVDAPHENGYDPTCLVPCNETTLTVFADRSTPGVLLVQVAELDLHTQQIYVGYISGMVAYLSSVRDRLYAQISNYKNWELRIREQLWYHYFEEFSKSERTKLSKSDPAVLQLATAHAKLDIEHKVLEHRISRLDARISEVSRNLTAREHELRASGYSGYGGGNPGNYGERVARRPTAMRAKNVR